MASTSSTSSRVDVRVRVISPVEIRNNARGPYGVVSVIDQRSTSVKELSMPTGKMERFQERGFLLLKNVVVGDTIKVFDTTKILQCGNFQYPEELEEEFTNPPEVTVVEAVTSARKRRVSITGELIDVSPIWSGPSCKRKVLKLSSQNRCIQVKLWNEKANLLTPPIGQQVKVSCVKIEEYQGNKDANSTALTTVEDVGETVDFQGFVEAASFDIDDNLILLEDESDECRIDNPLMLAIFPDEIFVEGVRVRGTRRGREIESIDRVDRP